MSALFEGQGLKGRATNVEIGVDKQGRARVRWDMVITEGEFKGRVAKYSGKLDADNIKYTKRDMVAIGWRGEKSSTFVADVEKANLVVEFDAEIAEHNGRQWVSARFGGGAPLNALDNDKERELDRLFSQAGPVGGGDADAAPF